MALFLLTRVKSRCLIRPVENKPYSQELTRKKVGGKEQGASTPRAPTLSLLRLQLSVSFVQVVERPRGGGGGACLGFS
jgi:hypothetical protein